MPLGAICFLESLSIAYALLRTPIFSSLSWQLFLTLLRAFHLAQLLEAVYKNKKQTKVSDIRMKPLLLLLACSHGYQ